LSQPYFSRKDLQAYFVHGFDELFKQDLSSVLNVIVLEYLDES
jgi:hypothetical protein